MKRASMSIWIIGFVSLSLYGCGASNNPPTVAVGGSVSRQGTPLTSGIVRFNPVDPKNGRPAEGKIRSDGKFTLSTFASGDGAIAGEYGISVIPVPDDPNALAKDVAGKKPAIPEKFSDPQTSGLKEKIEAGKPKTDLKLELKE